MISGTRYQLTAEINRQTKLAQEIARGSTDISTKKRIQAPSDDPAAAARVATIRQSQADQKTWATTVETAAAVAGQADGVLTTLATSIDRARSLMLSANNGTLNNADRSSIATELRGIAEDIQALSTTKDSRGYPLFPDEALLVPVSDTVKVAATTSKASVFEAVPTAAGPVDLAQIMLDAATAVETTEATARGTASTASLAAIEVASDRMAAVRGEQGVRAARIDNVRETIASSKLTLAEERSGLEDTDIQETIARISASQTALDAARAVFARVNKSTLFDLLG